jgi:hypothetical protein
MDGAVVEVKLKMRLGQWGQGRRVKMRMAMMRRK